MFKISLAQAYRRLGRTLAVMLAIVTASVSFALLTSAVATSRLQVQGTVDENFRSAYDILVRPAQSRVPLEESDGLVQSNFLSAASGGITLKQVRQISDMPGIEVAAPVAMIGYTLPAVQVPVVLDQSLLDGGQDQVFSLEPSWTTDRGLSQIPDRRTYLYYTKRQVEWKAGPIGPTMRDPESGESVAVCQEWADNHVRPERSAFDLERKVGLTCDSSNPPQPGRPVGVLRHGQVGFNFYYQLPMLIAAIDPVAEAKLVGLDEAVETGRYLTEQDRTRIRRSSNKESSSGYREVPVLMANRPLTDDNLTLRVRRLDTGSASGLVQRLTKPGAEDWLAGLPGKSVHVERHDDTSVYPRLLKNYSVRKVNSKFDYWSSGQSAYEPAADGALDPQPVKAPAADVFRNSYFGGYYAPQASGDVGFRDLELHEGSTFFVNGVLPSPNLNQVGVFDPDKIAGFSELSRVPLTTYRTPDALPGDARSKRLLKGESLLPNANLAGYLQQPPMMLTTLRSLPSFYDTDAFFDIDPQVQKAPVSVIRIRVAGVTGVDDVSQERVRLAAERILRETGLTVDITVGSSPTKQSITLPAGNFGRPELTLIEGWVKKGVSVSLLSQVDRKSLALFGLVLITCLLFLTNAAIAAVRTRRAELGVLACLGWSPRKIFAMILIELLVVGCLAGALGTAIAAGLVGAIGLNVTWWHIGLIAPVAALLAALAGVGPAWSASHTLPIEAIRPAVRPPRRATRVTSLSRLAVVGVARQPGRTILGAASLFVGVAALAVLTAIQQTFQGGVVGTALGDAISVQVRGVDYLAAAVTIGLGAVAVADVAYLNISERQAEIGTLRSSGWREGHLRRLIGTEALLTAGLGALCGAVLGASIAAAFLPVSLIATLTSAALAGTGGVVAALLAVAVPLSRLSKLAPASAIASE